MYGRHGSKILKTYYNIYIIIRNKHDMERLTLKLMYHCMAIILQKKQPSKAPDCTQRQVSDGLRRKKGLRD